jgi:hypothetical protein
MKLKVTTREEIWKEHFLDVDDDTGKMMLEGDLDDEQVMDLLDSTEATTDESSTAPEVCSVEEVGEDGEEL